MNSLTDYVIGLFLICVWISYEGSLIDDVAAFIARMIK